MGLQTFAESTGDGTQLMTTLAKLISERAVKSMFVTAVYARFVRETMEMKYTNCGHCFPMIYGEERGDILCLSSLGRPLGVSFGLKPVEQTVKLMSGDRILLYTDGIVETLNDFEEEFGEERLGTYLRENYDKSKKEFSDGLFDALRDFSGKDEKIDDITLAIIDVL
jgi:sigma-B regulation protein RsbU (phosphoserine phosphatase)